LRRTRRGWAGAFPGSQQRTPASTTTSAPPTPRSKCVHGASTRVGSRRSWLDLGRDDRAGGHPAGRSGHRHGRSPAVPGQSIEGRGPYVGMCTGQELQPTACRARYCPQALASVGSGGLPVSPTAVWDVAGRLVVTCAVAVAGVCGLTAEPVAGADGMPLSTGGTRIRDGMPDLRAVRRPGDAGGE
jgi:hypothetical protein